MSQRSGVILLVEDTEDDIILTRRAFARAQLRNEIVVVRDGVEALDWLRCEGVYAHRSPAEVPDVVLLDLHLPRLDGIEVLRQLRADLRTRSQPVVVLTSSAEERDVVASYDLGANGFVRKPVDFDEFIEAAGILGLYWLALNEPPIVPRPRRSW